MNYLSFLVDIKCALLIKLRIRIESKLFVAKFRIVLSSHGSDFSLFKHATNLDE